MKKTCLILMCIVTSMMLNAQQWEIDFGDPSTFTWLDRGIVDADQNVIFFGRSGSDKTDCYPYIMRVDQNGNHQSFVLGDQQFHNLRKLSVVQMEDGKFFMVGEKEQSTIYAIILDSDFTVLSCKRYDKPEEALSMMGGLLVLDHDGTVVLAGNCNYPDNNWGLMGSYYFCRFDNNADTIASRFYTLETHPEIYAYDYGLDQLLLSPQTDRFVLLGSGISGMQSLLQYDQDFNYVDGYQLSANRMFFISSYSDHWLSNDQLLVMGRVGSFTDNLESIGLARVGLEGPMEPINRFYCKQDTILQSRNRSMAYVNDTTIYGAIGHFLALAGPCITRICLYNTDMELLGLKEITTEETNHFSPGSILSTPDGGCILSVMEYHIFGQSQMHGKIVKLSREDLNPIPCSVKDVPNVAAIEAAAYPNPATTELNIDISGLPENKEHRVQISDAMGRVCMDRIIRGEGNVLTVGISTLKPGVYIYTIYNTENDVVRNKFIKE